MAARESGKAPDKAPEKAMDGLLRETLRHAAPSSGPCPEPEILAAYFERTLDKKEISDYELHLSQCARCREQQAAMARTHTPARETEAEKPRWASLWDWRWLAPATAVLAVAFIWYARSTEMTAEKHPQPAVASSEPVEPPVSENAPLVAENKLVPPPLPPPSSRAIGAPEKTERQQSVSRQKYLQTPADRKAADEFASNLETDALKKDSKDVRRDADANAPSPAGGVPPAVPARAAPSTTGVQSSAAVGASAGTGAAANEQPVAAAKAKQAAPPAPADRSATFGASNLHSGRTLVRTPNPQILWRLGTAGLVERSIDGGATWAGQIPSAGAQLTAGSAPTEKICWLAGRGGLILLTTNGVDWKAITAPAKLDFSAIVAEDAFEVTVTAPDGQKFTTTDGGETWRRASLGRP